MERLSLGRTFLNWVVLLCAVLFLLASIWYLQRTRDRKRPKPPQRHFSFNVRTSPVLRGTLQHTILVSGEVRARRTTVRTELEGTVAELHFRDGATVTKGALLVKLLDRDQKLLVLKQKAMLSQADAAVKRARSNLLAAVDEHRRLAALKIGLTVTESELVRAKYQKSAAEATLAEMRSTVQLRRVELQIAEKDLALTVIRAPSSGRISGLSVEINDQLAKNQKLLEIVSVGFLDVELFVSPDHQAALRPKMGVSLRPSNQPKGRWIDAHITRIHAGLDQTTRNQRVVVTLDGWPDGLVPELTVEARLGLAVHKNVLMVHQDALIRMGKEWVVFVVRKGRAERVPVVVVAREQERVEVTGLLAAGERVVVIGNEALFPLAPVREIGRKPPQKPVRDKREKRDADVRRPVEG